MPGVLRSVANNADPSSLAARMRRARFAFFMSLLPAIPRPVSVLDIGGTQQFWNLMGDDLLDGIEVTLVNLDPQVTTAPGFRSVIGDARALTGIADRAYDVVFSNSVIEHVGSFADQRLMANEVRRVGRCYFVQTPNRYFPLEPHFLFPGFQFLPLAVRAWLVAHFNLGWIPRASDRAAARRTVEEISLLGRRQLQELFPGARIYAERILGMTKSFTAYGGWEHPE